MFIMAYSFYAPYFSTHNCVCLVATRDKQTLMDLLIKEKIHCNFGTTSRGQNFCTSEFGLIIFTDIEIKDRETFYELNGFHILYPFETLKIVQENKLLAISGYIKGLKDAGDVKDQMRINAEKKEKEKYMREQYQKDGLAFIQSMVSVNPASKSLAERLWSFDIWYGYSDDPRVYRSGEEKENALRAELTALGFDAAKVYGEMYRLRTKK